MKIYFNPSTQFLLLQRLFLVFRLSLMKDFLFSTAAHGAAWTRHPDLTMPTNRLCFLNHSCRYDHRMGGVETCRARHPVRAS